jgi:hypothetical protein
MRSTDYEHKDISVSLKINHKRRQVEKLICRNDRYLYDKGSAMQGLILWRKPGSTFLDTRCNGPEGLLDIVDDVLNL